MIELLTAAQMRAIEQAAIASGDVTGLELMERAGQGVVDAVFEEWPELSGEEGGAAPQAPRSISQEMKRAVVLCGPGNNGGDGFVVARLLKERGWEVEVFLYGDAGKLPPDARVNYERWGALGTVTARAIDPPSLLDDSLCMPDQFDLLVDGLFGTGLSRPFSGLFSFLASERELLELNGVKVVAIDIPSGVCSDSGVPLKTAITANLTTTFHRGKLGHYIGDGAEFCGKIVIKDIGLESGGRLHAATRPAPKWAAGGRSIVHSTGTVHLAEPFSVAKWSGHKFSHGHALILSGGAGKTGAARLAARGALRIGAGLVTLGVPGSAQMEVASQITALMLTRADDVDGLARVLEDERLNALCLGPGMGVERARALVPVALAAKRATVLDADALTAFADAPETLFEMLHPDCVLTPHGGEFARLFPDIAAKLKELPVRGPAYSKVDTTRAAAARAGCTVLFKGSDTVIADETGRCSVHAAVYDRAAPWLATAGSGDVLAGFITGLLARGFAPMIAAESGAWLHAECALQFGPGLIAEDLPEQLPAVLRSLGP